MFFHHGIIGVSQFDGVFPAGHISLAQNPAIKNPGIIHTGKGEKNSLLHTNPANGVGKVESAGKGEEGSSISRV